MLQTSAVVCTRSLENRLCTVFILSPMSAFLLDKWVLREFPLLVILPGNPKLSEMLQHDPRVLTRLNKIANMDEPIRRNYSQVLGRTIRRYQRRIFMALDECTSHFFTRLSLTNYEQLECTSTKE